MDVHKSHDDNNGGGQREKVKRVTSLKMTLHIPYSIMSRKSRHMFQMKNNELFSGQEIGKARMLQSEESQQNPSRSFWGRRK